MSLNTAHANGGVLIFNGEAILLYCDGVELQFEGGTAKEFGGTKKGRIYLTTHRMIFTNKNSSDPMQSFSFPFFSMTGIELEQPIFGANYIKGKVHAQQGGNWNGEAIFKLKFLNGGAIEYGQAMLQAAKMASRYMPPQPPPYTHQQGPYYPAPPPAYTPPAGGYSGFTLPTHVFPDAPPANSVYMSNMPPPYPGIYPPPYVSPPGYPSGNMPQQPPGYPSGIPPQPPGYSAGAYPGSTAPPPGFNASLATNYNQFQPPMQNGGATAPPEPRNSKEQEAMASAYVNPFNPNNVFVPQPQPPYGAQFDGPPPPYSEASKKDQ